MITDGGGGVPALLRRAAASIERLGDVHVQDLAFQAEPDGGSAYLTVNLAFVERSDTQQITGVLGAFSRSAAGAVDHGSNGARPADQPPLPGSTR